MIDRIYQTGNTIRLYCEFFDFNNVPVNPPVIKVKIYDSKFNVITEFTNIKQDSDNRYYIDYTTELDNTRIYYEWYAEIEGTPSLKRSSFLTRFV